MLKRILTILGILAGATLQAQVTTSTLSGRVQEASEPLPGTVVLVTHIPTGTTSYAITTEDGSYLITGLLSGGPYTVQFSQMGYTAEEARNIILPLGEVTHLDATLKPEELQAAVVLQIGPRLKLTRTGSSENVTAAQIEAMPSINKSIEDYIRISPYANGMSLAGGDGRMTNFTVDGANFNNNYGLNSNLPGGGNPISIEAIDQIQVVISPYDVRQTGFIGGGINTVTKQGSNTFKASAYTYFDRKQIYGATLGGPIVKNKLFFFANYEEQRKPTQVILYRARLDNEQPGGNISRTLLSDMEKVKTFLEDFYGYNPGSATDFPGDGVNRKALARLDWNLSPASRLTLRYNYTFDKVWNAPNDNSADTGYRLTGTKRVGPQSMAFSGNMYGYNSEVHSAVLDLNSSCSEILTNQLLITFTHNHEYRALPGDQRFPHVDIMMEGALEPYMSLGDELFSRYTDFTNTVINFKDDVTFLLGSHTVTAGFSHEYQEVTNCYMRNGGMYYRYASLNDFLERKAPESFALTYGFDGVEQPSDRISYLQCALYVQDDWRVSENFKLSGGIRLDGVLFNALDFKRNDAAYAFTFRDGIKIDTGMVPTSKVSVSPRIGFSWDIAGNNSLILRGGTGLFLGHLPLVYFMNIPSYANLSKNSVQFRTNYDTGTHDPRLDQFAGGLLKTKEEVIDQFGLPRTLETHTAPYQLIGLDKSFKLPQTWKTTLALDYKVPVNFPFSLQAEAIFNKTVNGAFVDNPNLDFSHVDTWETFPDGRLRYPAGKAQIVPGKSVAYLTNTQKGYGVNLMAAVRLSPVKNLDLSASYAYTDTREMTGFPGNDLYSAFTNMPQVQGPGLPLLQSTQFVIPHKVTAQASYLIPIGLRISALYTAFSPAGYSYIYTNDVNGDGVGNDLMYIPASDDEILFRADATRSAEDQRAAFWAFVEQDPYLRSHKGQFAEAYAARAPFVHKLDLRLSQDLTFGRHRVQLSLTVLNVLNLFNKNWGMPQVNSASNGSRILTFMGADASGRPEYTFYPGVTKSYEPIYNAEEAWHLQMGLKYFFN